MLLDTIVNTDCRRGMKDIPDASVDLVITDCPYKIVSGGCRIKAGNDECSGILNRRRDNKRTDWVDEVRNGKIYKHNDIKFSDWVPDIFRILKPQTHFYVMVNDRGMKEMLNCAETVGFKLVNMLIWKKNNATPNKYYMKNSEFTLLFRKGSARNINDMGSLQCVEINNIIGNKLHPTQKPVELMELYIKNSSNEGDIVFDPFLGSGTTAVAAVNTNRHYLGFEIDAEYFGIACQRLDEVEGVVCE